MKQFIYRLVVSLAVMFTGVGGSILILHAVTRSSFGGSVISDISHVLHTTGILPWLWFFGAVALVGLVLLLTWARPPKGD